MLTSFRHIGGRLLPFLILYSSINAFKEVGRVLLPISHNNDALM